MEERDVKGGGVTVCCREDDLLMCSNAQRVVCLEYDDVQVLHHSIA